MFDCQSILKMINSQILSLVTFSKYFFWLSDNISSMAIINDRMIIQKKVKNPQKNSGNSEKNVK